MSKVDLNATSEVIAGEIKHFHFQNGGDHLLPKLERDQENENPNLIVYKVIEGESEASIVLQPLNENRCRITVNLNDSDRFACRIGVPGHSELGNTTILGAESSPRCEVFCNEVIDHLEQQFPLKNGSPGGRPRYDEDEWARKEYQGGRVPNEIYPEWRCPVLEWVAESHPSP